MLPVSLSDFPNELLYKIIGLLEHKDLQTLSSAGIKGLYLLLDPLLYNTIEIKLFNDSIRLMHNKSGGKANKTQLQYVQSLTITMEQPYYPNEKVGPIKRWGVDRIGTSLSWRAPWKDLKDVVTSLGNVTSVRWSVSSQHSAHQHKQSIPWGTCIDFNPILKLIASLPSLDTFSCNISNIHSGHPLTWKSTRFGFENLHSLKSVSFAVHCGGDFWALTIEPLIIAMRNSPELESLSLDFTHIVYAHKAGSLSLEKLLQRFPVSQPLKLRKLSLRVPVWNFQISRPSGIHLRNLTTLELRFPAEASFPSNPPFAPTNGGLWAVLSHHRVRIKHLYAPVSSELIEYIQTYSGIEYLRLYGIADDALAHRFHACLRPHMGSLKVLNISLIASPKKRWAFADHNTHIFAGCLELRELWVSIHSESLINTLVLLLRTCNSLPHLHWLSISPAVHPELYGSTNTHTFFLQWMYSTKKIFSELDITEILDLDHLDSAFTRSMHMSMTFTIDLGFYRLRGSWGVEPAPSRMLRDRSYQNFDPSRLVVEVIKPKANEGCESISFHWVVEFIIRDGKKFSQSEWPYSGPTFAIADGV